MRLILRGHHLLCLKGFQGYGYSEDFSENMAKINDLRKHEDVTIKLVSSSDDICKSCPNLKNNLCENEIQNKRIVEMDMNVLLKIDKNKEYNSTDLFKKIDEIFPDKKSVENICFNCIWHDKCLFYQNLD